MASGDEDELSTVFEGKKWPSVVGSKAFVDWVKGRYYALKDSEDLPEARTLAPSADLILQTVCSQYKISPDELFKSQRGVFKEPRNAAIYLIRRLRYDTLAEVGARLKIKKYSSVSSIIERMNRRMESEPNLKKRIAALTEHIFKSHRKT
jgi:chromosomal replication initiation ATPase DnaA